LLQVYMTYVQATSGGGGWPMSCFLTPDLQPFFAGTYFPPQDAYGHPGFPTVLRRIAAVWRENNREVREQSSDAMRQLAELTQAQVSLVWLVCRLLVCCGFDALLPAAVLRIGLRVCYPGVPQPTRTFRGTALLWPPCPSPTTTAHKRAHTPHTPTATPAGDARLAGDR
jgi:hypothetical protein